MGRKRVIYSALTIASTYSNDYTCVSLQRWENNLRTPICHTRSLTISLYRFLRYRYLYSFRSHYNYKAFKFGFLVRNSKKMNRWRVLIKNDGPQSKRVEFGIEAVLGTWKVVKTEKGLERRKRQTDATRNGDAVARKYYFFHKWNRVAKRQTFVLLWCLRIRTSKWQK